MPSIASSKVTMTTILSQRKAGPWKRDVEKKKGTDSILRPVPASLAPVKTEYFKAFAKK